MIMGKIGCNAIEPVDEARFFTEARQGLPCFEKCLLCQLASNCVIAYHVYEVQANAFIIALKELFEGKRVSCPRLDDELTVRGQPI